MQNMLILSEEKRIGELLVYERKYWDKGLVHIAGIDEAGRGPLAGPVVAAAVVFPPDIYISGINDSKKLSFKKRNVLFQKINEKATAVATGIVSEKEIDRINIYQATVKAMQIAVEKLNTKPEHLLIDGMNLSRINCSQTAIKGGDGISFSIASASIIAKVTRDRIMIDYDKQYPKYKFASNMGYGTKEHVQAIRKYGRCAIHRTSFSIKGWQ